MVHVPNASREAIGTEAETVQIAGVDEVNQTGKPELAEAFNGKPTNALRSWFGIEGNVMLWASRLTPKLCVTVGAGA